MQYQILTIVLLSIGGLGQASPLVEADERASIDWGNLEIKYYGEAASADQTSELDLKTMERKAWQDGSRYIYGLTKKVFAERTGRQSTSDKTQELAAEAGSKIARSTSSKDTTYFSDGSVRVVLESSLANALATARKTATNSRQLQDISQQPKNTGIIFELRGTALPLAVYNIVDQNGASLFGLGDVAPAAYSKRLMGRWFRKATKVEVNKAVGNNPVTIQLSPGSNGTFVADGEEWRLAVGPNRGLLHDAQIIFDVIN